MANAVERRRVHSYVRRLIKHLGLHEWHVSVEQDYADDEDINAEIDERPNIRSGSLKLGTCWPTLPDQERGETLVHEMLHLATADMRHFVHKVLVPTLPEDAQAPLLQAFEDLNETYIDRLAVALYPLLPKYGD